MHFVPERCDASTKPNSVLRSRRDLQPYRVLLVLALALVFGTRSSTNWGQETISGPDLEFFEKQVRPLLLSRCLSCHSNEEQNGGLSLSNREAVIRGGDTGPAFDSTDANNSLLLRAIRYKDEHLQMPPDGKMQDSEIEIFARWVSKGIPDPRPVAESAKKQMGMSIEEGRGFWSMKPLSNPAIPTEVSNEQIDRQKGGAKERILAPLDAFVARARLEKGLVAAESASKSEWIRRVYLDLIGLPPTWEQIEEFEQDDAPDCYERVADRLLDDPQYGVRWGRHWLDVVRYADSNGLDENLAFGTAWRYRDYVIQSWNQNKPFHRFAQEQIAGDLLPGKTQESHTGTGFLVLGAKVLAEPDREKLIADTIDEQVDAMGKVFLGLTLGCARCHDHKFDPIHQSDYYSLATIFYSTRTFANSNTGAIKHWNEISFASAEEKSTIGEINRQIAEKQAAFQQAKSKAMEELRQETRSKAIDYLEAAMQLDQDCSLSDCEPFTLEKKLHPRILLHCRTYLARFGDTKLLRPWSEFAKLQDVAGMRSFYEALLRDLDSADPELRTVMKQTIADATGLLAIPAKMEHALQPQQISELHALAESARLLESSAMDESTFMGVTDGEVIDAMPIHIRGNHRSFGKQVSRQFPRVLHFDPIDPILNRHESGRMELANWLTHSSNPLTARVIVNRIWGWHFGEGIVSTTENFGVLGDRPSHPELLDFLARDFIQSGWDLKALQRSIVLSSTYRQSSANPNASEYSALDPENRLLWKFSRKRLDAEQLRDSILHTCGLLDNRIAGKTVPLRNRQFVFDHTSIDHTKYHTPRRTAYFPIIRNNLAPLLQLFDFPDPTMPTGHRPTTSVAPQSLLLMNAPWVIEASLQQVMRSEVHSIEAPAAVRRIYQAVLSRLPTPREEKLVLDYLQESLVPPADGVETEESRRAQMTNAWAQIIQSLLLRSEFMFTP